MPSNINLLKAWASGERNGDSDVVARVALNEINVLQETITTLRFTISELEATLRLERNRQK